VGTIETVGAMEADGCGEGAVEFVASVSAMATANNNKRQSIQHFSDGDCIDILG